MLDRSKFVLGFSWDWEEHLCSGVAMRVPVDGIMLLRVKQEPCISCSEL
jgi:hypothetical protein